MSPAERERQIDRLCRSHRDAFKAGDLELASLLFRAAARHCRILDAERVAR